MLSDYYPRLMRFRQNIAPHNFMVIKIWRKISANSCLGRFILTWSSSLGNSSVGTSLSISFVSLRLASSTFTDERCAIVFSELGRQPQVTVDSLPRDLQTWHKTSVNHAYLIWLLSIWRARTHARTHARSINRSIDQSIISFVLFKLII